MFRFFVIIPLIYCIVIGVFAPSSAAVGVNLLGDENGSVNIAHWQIKESMRPMGPRHMGKLNNVERYILTDRWKIQPKKIPLSVLDEMRTRLPLPVLTVPYLKNSFYNHLDVAAKAIYHLGSWIRLWDLYYNYDHCKKDCHAREQRNKIIGAASKQVRILWQKILKRLDGRRDICQEIRPLTDDVLNVQLSQLSRYYRVPLTDIDDIIQKKIDYYQSDFSVKSVDPNLLRGVLFLGLYNHSWILLGNRREKIKGQKNPVFLTKGTSLIVSAFENQIKIKESLHPLTVVKPKSDLPILPVPPLKNYFELLCELPSTDDS